MSYDDVIIKLGEFGKYQKRIYFLLCLPAISCAFNKLSGVFIQAKVPYRCRLPGELENASYYLSSIDVNLYFPREARSFSVPNCTIYSSRNSTMTNVTVPCTGWVYDHSQYIGTTITEWDWVCDRAWFKAISDALLMAGVMAGSIVFGDLSDRFGRKIIFFISIVTHVLFGILTSIAPDMYTYLVTRFIMGSTNPGFFLVAYVLDLTQEVLIFNEVSA